MKFVVSSAVLGEKSADEFSNHRFRSSLTVPLEGATPLPSAEATIAASARCASRFPPLNVLYVQRF